VSYVGSSDVEPFAVAFTARESPEDFQKSRLRHAEADPELVVRNAMPEIELADLRDGFWIWRIASHLLACSIRDQLGSEVPNFKSHRPPTNLHS
jgi:hypothetical protein